jgi:hypothetical protein
MVTAAGVAALTLEVASCGSSPSATATPSSHPTTRVQTASTTDPISDTPLPPGRGIPAYAHVGNAHDVRLLASDATMSLEVQGLSVELKTSSCLIRVPTGTPSEPRCPQERETDCGFFGYQNWVGPGLRRRWRDEVGRIQRAAGTAGSGLGRQPQLGHGEIRGLDRDSGRSGNDSSRDTGCSTLVGANGGSSRIAHCHARCSSGTRASP